MTGATKFSPLSPDYAERVYAGVLGKIIGVYLGRPFEQWSHERIERELGEIWYYVNDRLKAPLVVTDDDISGTFTFLRALPDYEYDAGLTPKQIGQTWLNYIIENRTILWWGGMGNSTEHTAYIRLKNGMEAPESGSIALNGEIVAEQIGSQIFIDGWGLIHPGDPQAAADFAKRAASVSHDGAAIHGAQVVAAMVAKAFVEQDIDKILDSGVSVIPAESIIATLIGDIRAWHLEGLDWRVGFAKIAEKYGYDKYLGGCHMVPNHALIIHALLHGQGDFQKSLMIVNTCGWDTDCNSANVGCILGVRNGLAGIDNGPDWRGPVADRIFIPTADGGRCISDAVTETYHVINAARGIRNLAPEAPKNGARFHFEFPGSVQGFEVSKGPGDLGKVKIENTAGRSKEGNRSLAIRYEHLGVGQRVRVTTRTYSNETDRKMGGYGLFASPTLYSGQRISVRLEVDTKVSIAIGLSVQNGDDKVDWVASPVVKLEPGDSHVLEWTVPDTNGFGIEEIGLQITSDDLTPGSVYLDSLNWTGEPRVTFKPTKRGNLWRGLWVNGADEYEAWCPHFKVCHNQGTGLILTGTREWRDICVTSKLTINLGKRAGIAVRVQGMRRYYALLLCRDGFARLVKAMDGDTILAEIPFAWAFGDTAEFCLQVNGHTLIGSINGREMLRAIDENRPLNGGGIALVVEEGKIETQAVEVSANV